MSRQIPSDLTTAMATGFLSWSNEKLSGDYFADWHSRMRFGRHPLAVLLTVGVVATIVALTLDPRSWPLAIICGAAVLIGLVWPRVSLLPLSAELSFVARRAVEQEPVEARLRIANRAPWSAQGLGFEQEGAANTTSGTARLLPLAPPTSFSDETFSWSLTPPRRGRFPRRTPQLVSGFPFGLELRRKAVQIGATLLVRPRSRPIEGLPRPRRLPTHDGVADSCLVGTSGTTLGVRPYRRGDARRDVHWRQTARHGELIVREREAAESARVCLIVDAARSSCGYDDPETTLDWLTRFAASILSLSAEMDAAVEVAVPAARGGVVICRGETALDALAELELDEGSSSRTFREAMKRMSPGIEPWYITTPAGFAKLSPSEQAASGWSFLLVETPGVSSAPPPSSLISVAARVYRCSSPLGSPLSPIHDQGAFCVRAIG